MFGAKSTPPLIRIREGEPLRVGERSVRVVETPGHTAGSVSYVVADRFLFVGDTLRLLRGEVRPMFAGFNHDQQALAHSIHKLARLPGIECLLTAHFGVTVDLAQAFRRWRPPASDAPTPEGDRP